VPTHASILSHLQGRAPPAGGPPNHRESEKPAENSVRISGEKIVAHYNHRCNRGLDNAQTLCDEPDTVAVDRILLDTRSVLIRIAELAEDPEYVHCGKQESRRRSLLRPSAPWPLI